MSIRPRPTSSVARWCSRPAVAVFFCLFLPSSVQSASFEPTPEDLRTIYVTAANLPPALKTLGQDLFAKSIFDGEWYSPTLRLGLHISGQDGVATVSNSPNFKTGDRILFLRLIERAHQGAQGLKLPWFDGDHIHVDGQMMKVQGRLTTSGEFLIIPLLGLLSRTPWKMQRVRNSTNAAKESCTGNATAFDGAWYSPELRYGILICNGVARFTMPPREPWVQRPSEPLKIVTQSGVGFEGSLAQTNGRTVNVRGTRTKDNQIRMELAGLPAVNWIAVGGQGPPPSKVVQPVIVYGSTQLPCPAYTSPSSGTAGSTSPVAPTVPFGPYAQVERDLVSRYGLTGGELRIAGRELSDGITSGTRQRYQLASLAARYAALSQAVYQLAQQVDTDADGVADFRLDNALIERNDQFGFKGAAYIGQKTEEIVVAFAGTELQTPADLITDVTGGVLFDAQLPTANKLFERSKLAADRLGYKVRVTGHSLGGRLAQAVAARHAVEAFTFHAAGVSSPDIAAIPSPRIDGILNVITAHDWVRSLSQLGGGIVIGGRVCFDFGDRNSSLANHIIDPLATSLNGLRKLYVDRYSR